MQYIKKIFGMDAWPSSLHVVFFNFELGCLHGKRL